MNKENVEKFARLLGHVLAACAVTCLCAVAIALTVRFVMWIF